MADINLSTKGILIVDDVRVTRIGLAKMLQNMGAICIDHADNGHEALTLLKEKSDSISCVISDFNMPVIHGLQLVKNIRTGMDNIRRDLPVIMVTGIGDRDLLGVAMALDVNSFLLKPVTLATLQERLMRVLQAADSGEGNTKPREAYQCIDVNTSIRALLTKNVKDPDEVDKDHAAKALAKTLGVRKIVTDTPKPPSELERQIVNSGAHRGETIVLRSLHLVPVNSKLGKDVFGFNGQKLLIEDTVLTKGLIERLKDLAEMGEPTNKIWIREEPGEKK